MVLLVYFVRYFLEVGGQREEQLGGRRAAGRMDAVVHGGRLQALL